MKILGPHHFEKMFQNVICSLLVPDLSHIPHSIISDLVLPFLALPFPKLTLNLHMGYLGLRKVVL